MFKKLHSFHAQVDVLGKLVAAVFTSDVSELSLSMLESVAREAPEDGPLNALLLVGITSEDVTRVLERLSGELATRDDLQKAPACPPIGPAVQAPEAPAAPAAPAPAAALLASDKPVAEASDEPEKKRRGRPRKTDVQAEAPGPTDPRQQTLPETAAEQPATALGRMAEEVSMDRDAAVMGAAPSVVFDDDIPFGKPEVSVKASKPAKPANPDDPWGLAPPPPAAAVPTPAQTAPVVHSAPPVVEAPKPAAMVPSAPAKPAPEVILESEDDRRALSAVADMKRFGDVVKWLAQNHAVGTVTEMIETCERLKPQVPVLARVADISERVPRTLEAMGIDLPV